MTKRVGLMVGREWSFPPRFIEEVAKRKADVEVEFVKIGASAMNEPVPYAVIVDRISHEVPYYRSYLKNAVLQGVTVVNNPFMWSADDKYFDASLATRLGVASPKTMALPNKAYIPGIVPEESLRNLVYPLDWKGIVEHIGMPCILKDAHGGGWKEVYVCRSLDELIHHYDNSGLLNMIVQEFIEWEQFVRCLCIGQEQVLPMKYDPKARKYLVEHDHLSPELGGRIVQDSLTLCRALGYDMNSLEFAVRGGIPFAIDFMNCAPDMDIYSLTPHYFEWVVNAMADMVIRLAKNPRKQAVELKQEIDTHNLTQLIAACYLSNDSKLPKTPEDTGNEASFRDPWGHQITFTYEKVGDKTMVIYHSNGPDGQPGTEDDVIKKDPLGI